MSAIHVVDTRVVTSLGMGREALWRGLLAGHTGIAPVRRFATDGYTSSVAGCIAALDAERDGSRLGGLIEMLFDESPSVPADTTLFTATTKAGIDQLEQAVRTQRTAAGPRPGLPGGGSRGGSVGREGTTMQHQCGLCVRDDRPGAGSFADSAGRGRVGSGLWAGSRLGICLLRILRVAGSVCTGVSSLRCGPRWFGPGGGGGVPAVDE